MTQVVLKPHISFYRMAWRCRVRGPYTCTGWGRTPAAAYGAWLLEIRDRFNAGSWRVNA